MTTAFVVGMACGPWSRSQAKEEKDKFVLSISYNDHITIMSVDIQSLVRDMTFSYLNRTGNDAW